SGMVGSCLPTCYAAYARLFHPAKDLHGGEVTWAEVAAMTGRKAHSLMQWHAIVGSADPYDLSDAVWQGDRPRFGYLSPRVSKALCLVLSHHTDQAGHCFFGLWKGQTWFTSNTYSHTDTLLEPHTGPDKSDSSSFFSAENLVGGEFQLQGREY